MAPDTISSGSGASDPRGRPTGRDQRFEAMVAHAPVGLAILDGNGAFRYINVATSRLLGYTADSLVNRQAVHLVHPDETTRVADTLAAAHHQPGRTVAI